MEIMANDRMTVAELRRALEGVPDETPVTLLVTDDYGIHQGLATHTVIFADGVVEIWASDN